MRRLVIGAIVMLAVLLAAGAAAAWRYLSVSPYADWAVVVASGDFHAHDGSPSLAFDNARRDVVRELEQVGFAPEHIKQYSAWARYFGRDAAGDSNARTVGRLLRAAARQAPDGCLLYFTTHGLPEGIILGNEIFRPSQLAAMVNASCGARPTIVVVSACFSGVFVPKLAAPNRIVITAARPDRTSFGCGTTDRYPYYDTCFLQTLSEVHDFRALAYRTRACVAQMEEETGAEPPSEPQIAIGGKVMAMLQRW